MIGTDARVFDGGKRSRQYVVVEYHCIPLSMKRQHGTTTPLRAPAPSLNI
jgi:hypothetical protein